jgi:hypothetical protein
MQRNSGGPTIIGVRLVHVSVISNHVSVVMAGLVPAIHVFTH